MMYFLNGKICLLAFVGIVFLVSNSRSHAANEMSIINSWTLPQDGFTAFYRFFRDKISWYEADAVCQFHHANLVTVDNGVKYDASRAFLSDLNITENVWIGLMRSQNSDRFMWSNSKILDREFGYWAEQIPAIEAPLCAVTDPSRDYRWHSFHCGGPETAAFLCEMEVPDWATECLIRALPSLTIQYFADSASIQLSRDCGSEGIRRLTCNGKHDQDFIQRELLCMSEREKIDSDGRIKSDEMIEMSEYMLSDNMESNNIENLANQIEASVEKMNNIPNSDELMMGDQPQEYAEQTKPLKYGKKIASEPTKKSMIKQTAKPKSESMDDIMIADQPVSQAPSVDKQNLVGVTKVIDELKASSPKSLVEEPATTENRNRRETEIPAQQKSDNVTMSTESSASVVTAANTSKITVNAPNSQDHFLPPMLLVHHDNATVALHTEESAKSVETTTVAAINSTTPNQLDNRTSSSSINAQTILPTSEHSLDNISTLSFSPTVPSEILIETSTIPSTTQTPSTATTASVNVQIPNEQSKSSIMMRPHAPKFGGEILFHAPTFFTTKPPMDLTATEITTANTTQTDAINSTEIAINSTEAAITDSNTTLPSNETTLNNETITTPLTTSTSAGSTSEIPYLEIAKRSNGVTVPDKHPHKTTEGEDEQRHADFTNSNLDFQRYKPNRRRILTKAETHNYIQKIFG